MSKIPVLTATPEAVETRAALPRIGRLEVTRVQVESEEIATSLNDFLRAFGDVLVKQKDDVGGYLLEEVELSLAFDAKAGFSLVANGEVGVNAGIKVKLRKRKDQQ